MTPNSVKLLYPIINNSDGYIEESNGNKHLAIVPTDENNDTLKKYKKKWSKIKDIIRSTNNDSDNYDEKYMKIKFNSDDDLPLQKTLELYDKIITVTFLFNDGNKYYPQVFLVEYLFKLAE